MYKSLIVFPIKIGISKIQYAGGAFQIVVSSFGRWGNRPKLRRGWFLHQPLVAATI